MTDATSARGLPAQRPPALRPTTMGTLTHGIPVSEVLRASTLTGARLVAGAGGLHRIVQRLNVMEVPDILPWVKPHELLLTTGYPLRHSPQALTDLVSELDSRGLAALAIKLGRYVDALPDELLAQANRLDFPVIVLPNDVGFDDILEQLLTDILNRQAALLQRAEEIHRVLVQIVLAGGGLQELADEVATRFGGVVRVTDNAGRLVASSAVACENAVDDSAPGWLRVPVVAAGVHHGVIAALAADRDPDASDVHLIERAATVAALVVTRQLAVTAVESKYQADFLRDVLDGRAGDHVGIVAHGETLGWRLDRPVLVAVAEVDDGGAVPDRETQERLATTWARLVRQRDSSAAVAGYAHEVVAVVGAQRGEADALRVVREVHGALASAAGGPKRPVSVGVSRVTESAEALPAAYAQAGKALRIGRQVSGTGAVSRFDDLGVYRLLALVPDGGELRSFVRETLGELAESSAEAVDLRHTLEVLLDTNLNVAETARRLHFHYNTLRYRIGKLERLLGPFTEDATLRLDIVLALRVLRMRGL